MKLLNQTIPRLIAYLAVAIIAGYVALIIMAGGAGIIVQNLTNGGV